MINAFAQNEGLNELKGMSPSPTDVLAPVLITSATILIGQEIRLMYDLDWFRRFTLTL